MDGRTDASGLFGFHTIQFKFEFAFAGQSFDRSVGYRCSDAVSDDPDSTYTPASPLAGPPGAVDYRTPRRFLRRAFCVVRGVVRGEAAVDVSVE